MCAVILGPIVLMIMATLWGIPLLVWLAICQLAIPKWGDRARKARIVGIGVWLLLTVAVVGFLGRTGHQNWQNECLACAVGQCDASKVSEHLDRGGDPNGEYCGEHYLAFAAERGETRMVQLLLKHGADPNAVSPGGVTALSVANNHGNTEIVKLLRKAGATK